MRVIHRECRLLQLPVLVGNGAACSLCVAMLEELGQNGNDICDPSGRNQSHVGRVRFLLRAEMHGRAHITDSCFIAFITSKIC